MKAAILSSIHLAGRRVDYRLIRSKAAKRLRVRVGPAGVEVVQPAAQRAGAVEAFLHANDQWIIAQLERIERLYPVRRPHTHAGGEILYRGASTPVQVIDHAHRQGPGKVVFEQERLLINVSSGQGWGVAPGAEPAKVPGCYPNCSKSHPHELRRPVL